MSEVVDSFNDKIDEIKEDKEKFEILVGEFFESKDINIKELLAEMMLHVIMTRGEELQIKFKELEDRRSMYGDWITNDQTIGIGIPGIPVQPCIGIGGTGTGIGIGPNQWTYTSNNTYITSAADPNLGLGLTGALGNNTDYSNIAISNTSFDLHDLDIDSIVENVDLKSDTKVNTKLFQDAVTAMATWSSNTAK